MANSSKALISKAQSLIDSASPDQKRRILRLINADIVEASALASIWKPDPRNKPQIEAYRSEADEVFYGGEAGGGKTDLLIGLSLTAHRNAIIYRRIYRQLQRIRERFGDILSVPVGENTNRFTRGDKIIRLGAAQRVGEEKNFQGQDHDLKAFDEVPQFAFSQYEYLTGWNRTTVPGQRCRIVATGNMPTCPEEEWIIERWAPWLDPEHPKPAKSGELRWFAMVRGEQKEVHGAPFTMDGEVIFPKSRTFIKAGVKDNPYLNEEYIATLQALREPLRSILLKGKIMVGLEDDQWQVIPTDWILQAQSRWTEDGANGRPMDALGVDPARGGGDEMVMSPRHGPWFAPQICVSGKDVKLGGQAAALIVKHIDLGAVANIDVIGIGSSPADYTEDNDIPVSMLNSAEKSDYRDRSGKLSMKNKRAEWWWQMYEALDPDFGMELALPPDRQLRADLASARWKLTAQGVQIESKDEIRKRLGRSPDRGEAAIYALVDERPPSMLLSAPQGLTQRSTFRT